MATRFLDIVLSFLLLVIFSPILLCVSVILSVTAEKEIIYVQERIGLNGRKFNLIKFATMLKTSPNIGNGTVTVKNDPRILPFGRFLRKSKINELPQLINVIKGDMTMVGPRPQAQRNFRSYPLYYQKLLIKTKPGLTSVASLIFRNEEDLLADDTAEQIYDCLIMPYKAKIEEYFITQSGPRHYWKTLMLTFVVLVFGSDQILKYLFHDLPNPDPDLELLMRQIKK